MNYFAEHAGKWTSHNTRCYKAACEYMALTEMYDRTLTEMRSPHDPTEAYVIEPTARRKSQAYSHMMRRRFVDIYGISFDELSNEICRHSGYTAQRWIDEYERLKEG